MANLTIRALSTIATASVQAAGLSSAAVPIQVAGLSAPETRQLSLQQVNDIIVAASKLIAGTSSSFVAARGSAAVTGSSAINTGLAVITNLVVAIRGALGSSSAAVSWSALASSGWFSALVYANATATNVAPALSTIAVTVDWISVGS